MDKSVRIKIGASIDRDLANVFPSLESAAKKARATIQTEMNQAFAGVARDAKGRFVSPTVSAMRDVEKAAKSAGDGIKTPLIRAVESISKESRTTFGDMKTQFRSLGSEAEAQLSKIERATRKAAAETHNFGAALRKALDAQTRISAGGLAAAGRSVGGMGLRAGRFALSEARTIGMDLARGMGVQTDLTGMFQQGVSLESGAVALSNSAYQPGAAGAAGRRVSPDELIRSVRGVANETAMDPNEVLAGLREYVGKTGDLESGRRLLRSSAIVSRATGANMSDVISAAGDISLGLGVDFKGDRAKTTESLLRGVAGQGKLGAIEMSDYARQMAKVASQAGRFAGGPEHAMSVLSAIAQEARQQGGAATASQAATSVTGLAGLVSKGNTIENFGKFGINLYDKQGNLSGADDIIIAALRAASSSAHGGIGSFNQNMSKMISERSARRATAGFEKIYQSTFNETAGTEAQKTAAATQAVRDEFNRLQHAAMSLEETNESYRASMNTTEARVQVFNNKMSETADKLRIALIPAVTALAPIMLKAAEAAASWVDKLTGNAGSEKTATEAEQNLAMRTARTRRLLHGKPSEAALSGLSVDVDAMETEKAVIEKDIQRRKAAVSERTKTKQTPWWAGGLGGNLAGQAFDRLSGMKEQREAAVAGDLQRIQYQEQQLKVTNDTLREIHRKFDGVLKVQVVGGAGSPPAAPDNPHVRTGP